MPGGSSASLMWCKIASISRPTGWLKSMNWRTMGWSRISAGQRASAVTTSVVRASASKACPWM